MAKTMAPRTNPADKGGNRSRAKDKDFKREQRARNGTRSGSSGAGKKVAELPKIDLSDDIEGMEHITDLTGKLSHSQVGASGFLSATLQIPLEYAHEALAAHLGSKDGLVVIRMYGVSFEAYLKAAGIITDEDADFDAFDLAD